MFTFWLNILPALWPALCAQHTALDILLALWPASARVADTTDAPGARGSVDAHHVAEEFTNNTRSRREAWMVAQRELLEEAHRRCARLERLYVILDKVEDMTTILDLLARRAAADQAIERLKRQFEHQ